MSALGHSGGLGLGLGAQACGRVQRPPSATHELTALFRMRAQVDAFRDELDLERVPTVPQTALGTHRTPNRTGAARQIRKVY